MSSRKNKLSSDDRSRELAALIARYATAEGEQQTAIGNLYLARRSSPTQPVHTPQWPCFALVAQGAKSLTLGQEVYTYGVGDCLLVSYDVPVVSRVTTASVAAPHLGLGLAIDLERLREVLTRIPQPPRPRAGADTRGVAVTKAPVELVDAALRLVRLLGRPQEIPVLAPLIEQEILYRLMMSPAGERLLQIATAESPGNRVAKAIAWLRANFARTLRVEALARSVGMSPSSLHHHFKAVTALSPLQYQKRLRLHEARRLLLVEQLDVGSAADRVGYQSPSQFSREYSRLYGLSPLRDVGKTSAGEGGAQSWRGAQGHLDRARARG